MNPNLIYNGDFHRGTETWTGTGITTCAEGGVTLTGNLNQNGMYVPVASNRRYKISYDLKYNTIDPNNTNGFYISLHPYDSSRTFIDNRFVYKRANSMTTLASELKSGDTTVSLTSATGWTTGYVGIYDSKAYGESLASKFLQFSSISGTTVTLSAAYSGATITAGTKVANNYSSSTYYYPHMITKANLPTTWTTYTAEFNGGDSMRTSCRYFVFHTLGYTHNYSIRNIKIECISDYQECPYIDPVTPSIVKEGNILSPKFREIGMNIRYIRDTINGNTTNTSNHWNEIQVYNDVGENVALAHDVSVNGTVYANSVATDGKVDSSWLGVTSGEKTLTLDLKYIEHINKIKIWHYYPDGRTYNGNITEVSADGTNWTTVYQGTKPETADGNEIILYPDKMSILDNGIIQCHEIIEW